MGVYVAFYMLATLILYWYVQIRGSPGFSHVGVWSQKVPKLLARKKT